MIIFNFFNKFPNGMFECKLWKSSVQNVCSKLFWLSLKCIIHTLFAIHLPAAIPVANFCCMHKTFAFFFIHLNWKASRSDLLCKFRKQTEKKYQKKKASITKPDAQNLLNAFPASHFYILHLLASMLHALLCEHIFLFFFSVCYQLCCCCKM